ncbi:MAG: CoB--CoM heterodisulfide reductase iron-sulfur subunit B family protein [Desulfobacterales bacterium]|jgi:heterodisulfide reductase subunit B|nr:CoB--CoM heterodisulfide reductase iron-sulfur subunit B family protein [Desulfobacterales bacterium]
MRYLYYPGCSLEGTALEYGVATRAVMEALDAEIKEIDNWTCCGASAAESKSGLLSMVLPAVTLARAEEMNMGTDVLAPCSACYLNLKKVEIKTRKEPGLLKTINTVLNEENLSYRATIKVRHLLDILVNDIGPEKIKSKIRHPLKGLKIAPYYGCQCLRPYSVFDDPEEPKSMEPLLKAAGADIFPWNMGPKCCGAALLTTKREDGLKLVASILKAAKGADAIATVCPMCQMNLEAFQNTISKRQNQDLTISVVYLPQLLGAAMGINAKKLRIDLNLAVAKDLSHRLRIGSISG